MRYVIFVLCLCAVALWGCNGNQQQAALAGAGVVSAALALDQVVQSGDLERAVVSVALSDEELATVRSALMTYADARALVLSLGDDPERLLVARGTLEAVNIQLAGAYGDLRGVVVAHWDQYSAVDQSWFRRWQAMTDRYVVQRNALVTALDTELSADVRRQQVVEIARLLGQIALVSRPLWAGQ